MSVLYFYNIPGISRTNVSLDIDTITPISSITDSNYRIYNDNKKMKFSLPSNSRILFNYIKITPARPEPVNISFYYFVDDITYLNSNMVELSISIDTISTFKNYLYFRRLERTRTGNYSSIRENISRESTFYLNNYSNIDLNSGYVIIVRYKTPFDNTLAPVITEDLNSLKGTIFYDYMRNDSFSNYSTHFSDGLHTLIIPVPIKQNCKVTYYDGTTTLNDEIGITDFYNLISQLSNHPSVMNMYITRHLPKNISFNPTTNTYHMNEAKANGIYYKKIGNVLAFRSTLTSNTTLDVMYNLCNSIAMITTPTRGLCDSNYTKFYIGEKSDCVVIPIEYLEPLTSYTIMSKIDYSSGQRSYFVDNDILFNMNFIHVCNTIETLPLFNDNYNLYLSQNKGTLTTGIATKYASNAYNTLSSIIQSGAKGASSPDVVSGATSALVNSSLAIGDSAMSAYTLEQTIKENKENALWSPDTQKMGNNYSSDIGISALDRVVIEYRVGDYNDIDELRKYYGYPCHKVSEYANSSFLTVITDDPITISQTSNSYILVGDCIPYTSSLSPLSSVYYNDIITRIRQGIHVYDVYSDIGK